MFWGSLVLTLLLIIPLQKKKKKPYCSVRPGFIFSLCFILMESFLSKSFLLFFSFLNVESIFDSILTNREHDLHDWD